VKNVPACDVEKAVLTELRRVFQAPETLTEAFRVIRRREQQDRERLATERMAIDGEIATLKANASTASGTSCFPPNRSGCCTW